MTAIDYTRLLEDFLAGGGNLADLIGERVADARPTTDDELWLWVKDNCGLEIPRVAVCEGHVAPFKVLADLYFRRTTATVIVANRGGGKTFTVALLHYINGRTRKNVEALSFGATEAQAQRCYNHLRKLVGPEQKYVKEIRATKTVFESGCEVETVPGSEKAVNGPHPHIAHADEVELMDAKVFSESRGMALSGMVDGEMIPAQDIITSTRKRGTGPMQALIDEVTDARLRGDEPPYDVYTYCFAPGTMVRAERGLVPIEHVQVGERVLSAGGEFRPVSATMQRPYRGSMLSIRTTSLAAPMVVTPDHQLRVAVDADGAVARKPRGQSGVARGQRADWVAASQVPRGSFLQTEAPTFGDSPSEIDLAPWADSPWKNGRPTDRERIEVTDDLLWAFGMFCAEGHTAQGVLGFSTHRDEGALRDRLRLAFAPLAVRSSEFQVNAGCVQLVFYSTQLQRWFADWFGTGCANKRLPSILTNMSLDKCEIVVGGILDGDGCERFNVILQTSPTLAQQVAEVVLRRGGHPMIATQQKRDRRRVYALSRVYTDRPSGYPPEGTMRHAHPRGWWDIAGGRFAMVQTVEEIDYDGDVFDLTVEGDPSFVVGNVLVHNCIFEVAAQVPNCQVANPRMKKADRCTCDRIVKGTWEETGTPRTLRDCCKGRLYRSRGFFPFHDVRKKFLDNTRAVWEAQHTCEKPSLEGMVYPMFARERHCLTGFEPDPANGPIFSGHDFGGSHPFTAVYMQKLRFAVDVVGFGGEPMRLAEGSRVVFSEIYKADIGMNAYIRLMRTHEGLWKRKFPGWRVTARFADPQGKAHRTDMYEEGMGCSWWNASRIIQEGIPKVAELLDDGLLYIDINRAPITVDEIESYHYPPKKPGMVDDPDEPVDDFNHAIDALRYIVVNLSRHEMRADRQVSAPQAGPSHYVLNNGAPITASSPIGIVSGLPDGEGWRGKFTGVGPATRKDNEPWRS